ncbi:HAD family hydrolase [Bacillus sp. Marseille-P3800]|uniref:HAD family hydrolase n=1 Tax=Bacillus sp. Marseille-P3800 TaxID=2014782 RepID=UPI000C075F27|nr:HAD family hydrolase [Bacillus sp. Marseille-P3800]
MFIDIQKFHTVFNHPVSNTPTHMDDKSSVNRMNFKGEELVEFLRATFSDDKQFKESINQLMTALEEAKEKELAGGPVEDKLIGQADALTDILVFVMGSFVQMGIEPYQLFKIVHEANMGKLWPDGKPRFRDGDGKIVKPENWERDYAPEPKLREEIKRQIAASLTNCNEGVEHE